MEDQMSPDITSDDKLWAALSYVITPLVPIIILLMEDKKNRPFLKAHYMQALIFGLVFYVITSVLSFALIGLCVLPLGWILLIYWGFFKAYKGEYVEIPVITNLVKNQGWA